MALKTTNKRLINIRNISIKSKFIDLGKRFNFGSRKKVRLSKAKIGITISEFREKELAKFDSGFSTKAYLYTQRFY